MRRKPIIMLFIIVLSIQLLLTVSQWIHRPENVAVLLGSNLALRCLHNLTTGSVKWLFYANGMDNIPTPLTDDNGCLENSSRRYTCGEGNRILNFNCTDKTYAGAYECRTSRQEKIMQLIILESDPICETKNITVVESNYMEMWCTVNYSGHWVPVMEWGQDATENRSTLSEELNGNVFNRTTNNSVKSTLRLLADSRRRNSQYYCKTYFTNASMLYPKKDFAKNIPTYNYTWISPVINVLYGPKNLTITKQLDIFPWGILNCSAEADPSASYIWTDISSGNNIYGPLLILTENFISGENYTFECSAKNGIGLSLTTNITFNVPLKQTGVNAIITGSLISCLIVLLVLVVLAKRNIKVEQLCTRRNSRKSLDIIPSHEALPLGEENYALSFEDSTDQGAFPADPVYSAVHKNRETYEQSSSSHTEEAISNNSMYRPRANRQAKLKDNKNKGLDGIVYTELGEVPMDRRNRDPNIVREQIKKSEYAAIDHTSKAPPPPPKLIFNLNHVC